MSKPGNYNAKFTKGGVPVPKINPSRVDFSNPAQVRAYQRQHAIANVYEKNEFGMKNRSGSKVGSSKPGQFNVGRKGAKSLLTKSAKSSMAGAGMMYGGVLALLGELMFPKKTASDEQQKKHKKDAGY